MLFQISKSRNEINPCGQFCCHLYGCCTELSLGHCEIPNKGALCLLERREILLNLQITTKHTKNNFRNSHRNSKAFF